MKYNNHDGKVRTLAAEKQPFMGVNNYYTDALFYTDSCKGNLQLEEPDSGNEAEVEPEHAKECTL